MTLVPTRIWRQVLLVACLACPACGGDDVQLHLRFEVPDGDTSLSAAARVELVASSDGHRIAFVTADYAPGVQLAFDDALSFDDLSLTVTARDSSLVTVAYGTLPAAVTRTAEDAKAACCLTMCLCSVAVQDSGACDCGSKACEAVCE